MNDRSLRFTGFISYSWQDKRFTKRLHKALESYKFPKGVELAERFSDPRKLGHFFRDTEDMAAASDLGSAIRGAIADSENLIVICSPNAVQSRWVNQEVLFYKKTGRRDRIFAVIVDGEPNATEPLTLEAAPTECFPDALRFELDENGQITNKSTEPLALDARSDSFRKLVVRLAAGIANVPFDELWRREARRQRRNAASIMVAVSALIVGVTLGSVQLWRSEQAAAAARTLQEAAEEREAIATQEALERSRDRLIQVSNSAIQRADDRSAIEALEELHTTYADDVKASQYVASQLRWMRTPRENLDSIPAQTIASFEGVWYLRHSNGALEFADSRPVRIIEISKRTALIILADRALLIDTNKGELLDSLVEGQAYEGRQLRFRHYGWNGMPVINPLGSAVIIGESFAGTTNSQYWHEFLVVGENNKLSLMNPSDYDHSAGPWALRYLTHIGIAPDCRSIGFGVARQSDPKDITLTQSPVLEIGRAPKFSPRAEFRGERFVRALPANRRPRPASYDVELRRATELGCSNPVSDSFYVRDFSRISGVKRALESTRSPTSPDSWTASIIGEETLKPTPSWMPPLDCRELPPKDYGYGPVEQRECFIIEPNDYAERWDALAGGLPLIPTSMHHSGTDVDSSFVDRPLYTFDYISNAASGRSFCRRSIAGEQDCVGDIITAEHRSGWGAPDVRSKSGRYLAYTNGMEPFVLFDVLNMNQIESGHNLVVDPGGFEFDNSDHNRLVLVSLGKLHVIDLFEHQAPQQLNLGWGGGVGEQDGPEKVMNLVTFEDNEILIVKKNGQIRRLNWRTGRTSWEIAGLGLGDVSGVDYSPNRKYAMISGEFGFRVVALDDGSFASGIILPPYLSPSDKTSYECARYSPDDILDAIDWAIVDDEGGVSVKCGSILYRWMSPLPVSPIGNRIDTLADVRLPLE